MTISAVGFDLDYTLVVPDRDRSRLLDDAVTAVGAPPISREAYLDAHRRDHAGETRAPIFEGLLEGDERDDADGQGEDGQGEDEANARARELAREYREAVNDALVPVDGVESLLADLRERYHVGLLTNGPIVAQRGKLAALGWQDAFDAVVITGELTAGKPHPTAFEELVDVLGAGSEETAFVGDEVDADVGGATEAGLSAVQVLYPGGPERDPRAHAHVERDELADRLPSVVESL